MSEYLKPVVSLCIPTYNNANTIERCLKSAADQTFAEIEIILADDCSTDDTLGRAKQLADDLVLDISIHRNNTNLGLVGNHNQCLAMARGEFVKFLHADDTLEPACIEKMVNLAKNNDLALVFARRRIVSADIQWAEKYGRLDDTIQPLADHNDGNRVLANWLRTVDTMSNPIGEPTAVLFRADLARQLGGFSNRCAQLLDIDLWTQILVGRAVGFSEDELSVRHHSDTTTSAANKRSGAGWLDRSYTMIRLCTARNVPIQLRARALGIFAHDLAAAVVRGTDRTDYHRDLSELVRYSLRRGLRRHLPEDASIPAGSGMRNEQ